MATGRFDVDKRRVAALVDDAKSWTLAETTLRLQLATAPLAVTESRRGLEIAQIVHDLKQPLATIGLEMHMLDAKLGDHGHAELKTAVRRVSRNVEFMDLMVHDLLDSYAIDAHRFGIERAPTELYTLLARVIDRTLATRDRGRVSLEGELGITLSVDALRIERVVANLLQNALKYAPPSSPIVVRLESAPGLARISVIDAGPGVTDDELTFVFDKYRRGSRARAREGSGLGLYVSKQIIEAHRGHIGAERLGVGSRFFFELPLT